MIRRPLFIPTRQIAVAEVAREEGVKEIRCPGVHVSRTAAGTRLPHLIGAQLAADRLMPKAVRPGRWRSWARDFFEVGDRLHRIRSSIIPAIEELQDEGLRLAELDQARKICLEDGGMPGWDIHPEGIECVASVHDLTFLRALLSLLPSEVWAMSRVHYNTLADVGYRLGTNHGSPTFATSNIDLALHASMALLCRSWRDVEHVHAEVAKAYGLAGPLLAPTCLQLSRTGPSAKFHQAYRFEGNMIVPDGAWRGVVPRRRTVFGEPGFLNLRLQGLYASWRTIIKAIPGAYHTHPDNDAAAKAARGARYAVSDDISGFDSSVSTAAKLALGELTRELMPWARADVDVWLLADELPILAGPLAAESTAFLISRRGQLTSGIKLTNIVGTLLNINRMGFSLMRALNMSAMQVARAWMRGALLVWVQGDDSSVMCDTDLLSRREAYAEASAELGFKSELLPGTTFLMRYYPETGGWYPLASRIVQMTVFREHPPRSQLLEAVGFVARQAGFVAHPLAGLVGDFLSDGDRAMSGGQATTYDAVRRHLEQPDVLRALNADMRDWRESRWALEAATRIPRLFSAPLSAAIAQVLRRGLTSAVQLNSLAVGATFSEVMDLARYLARRVDDRPGRPPGRWAGVEAAISLADVGSDEGEDEDLIADAAA